MAVSAGPARLTVPLPEDAGLPRLGKIRLGRRVERTSKKTGNTILVPEKADHFVVAEDESEITSAAAVAAFHSIYGDEPRQIHCMLVGATPEENLEGAWRSYNQSKLKRRCDATTCSERTATGGWETKPCVCLARGLADDHDDHCSLDWTFQVVLPDVPGFGVWVVDTGSTISVRRLTGFMRLASSLRAQAGGSLAGYEFDLRLVPVTVNPNGVKGTVYVLDPVDFAQTPRQALSAAPVVPVAGELPAPVIDEDRDPLVQPTVEEREAAAEPAAAEPDADAERKIAVRTMITDLVEARRAELLKLLQDADVRPNPGVLLELFGDKALKHDDLVKALRARIRAAKAKAKADATRAAQAAQAEAAREGKTTEELAVEFQRDVVDAGAEKTDPADPPAAVGAAEAGEDGGSVEADSTGAPASAPAAHLPPGDPDEPLDEMPTLGFDSGMYSTGAP